MSRVATWLVVWLLAVSGWACVDAPGSGDAEPVDLEEWDGTEGVESAHWHYRHLERTTCANGSSAGMGLNYGRQADDLVVYLSGGGACWDADSCRHFRLAANLDVDYGPETMGRELRPLVDAGLFDREADVNPWPEAHYVFLPYCTGDMHAGRQKMRYGGFGGGQLVRHVGYDNIGVFVDELPRMFPDVDRVWIVGISAGGYGATWNFDRFRRAFRGAEVHLYADGAPAVPIDDERWHTWLDHWNPAFPDGCHRCPGRPEVVADHLAESYPESRFALSVFLRDPVLATFLGERPGRVESAVEQFVASRWSYDNTRAFVGEGRDHEALLMLDDGVESRDGEELAGFLEDWVDGW